MTGAGQVAATSHDINFAYPKGSFSSEASILKLAATLEALTLGAYLGAVESVQTLCSCGCRSADRRERSAARQRRGVATGKPISFVPSLPRFQSPRCPPPSTPTRADHAETTLRSE